MGNCIKEKFELYIKRMEEMKNSKLNKEKFMGIQEARRNYEERLSANAGVSQSRGMYSNMLLLYGGDILDALMDHDNEMEKLQEEIAMLEAEINSLQEFLQGQIEVKPEKSVKTGKK